MEYLKWDDIRLGSWELIYMNWEGVLIEEIISESISNGIPLQAVLQQATPEKTKKLLKILVVVNGKEYVESKYKNEKNIRMSVSDFKQIAAAYNIEVAE